MNRNYPPTQPICHIVGASPFLALPIIRKPGDLIIAADGGYSYLEQQHITPDCIVGDFDSLSEIPKHNHIITFPKEKDDTDMGLAIEAGIDKGYRYFYLYGGTGGRLDHTLANIQLLACLADQNKQGFLLDETTVITVIRNTSLSLPERESGIISVFSFHKEAKGVTLLGLKYPLTNATVTNLHPIGVSNEFTGKPATVTVAEGTLIVQWEPYSNLTLSSAQPV